MIQKNKNNLINTDNALPYITPVEKGGRGYLVMVAVDNYQDTVKLTGFSSFEKQSNELAGLIQKILPENAIFYKKSPDQFLIDFQNAEQSEIYSWVELMFAEKLEEKLVWRFQVEPVLSVGAVAYPEFGKTNDELLMNVQLNRDQNSYLCRQTKITNYTLNKCNYEFKDYCEDDRRLYTMRMSLESSIRQAVDKNFKGFEVYYQPQIDTKTGKCSSAEALLRWHDNEGNMVMAGLLIPALESLRLIDKAGGWVMHKSVRQCKKWIKKGAPESFSVSVNMSGSQLGDKNLAERILAILKQHELPPDRLTIELTETSIMHDMQYGVDLFGRIRGYGVSVSIDDFGSGYSSLNYLSRLPVDEIKIDSAFIMNMESDKAVKNVIAAIVEIAHSLGLRVCAEGVETVSQSEILIGLGVDLLQGYLYSPPVSAGEFKKKFIKGHNQSFIK